jgi:hypothetical protein
VGNGQVRDHVNETELEKRKQRQEWSRIVGKGGNGEKKGKEITGGRATG